MLWCAAAAFACFVCFSLDNAVHPGTFFMFKQKWMITIAPNVELFLLSEKKWEGERASFKTKYTFVW